jgi:hypothetical protein
LRLVIPPRRGSYRATALAIDDYAPERFVPERPTSLANLGERPTPPTRTIPIGWRLPTSFSDPIRRKEYLFAVHHQLSNMGVILDALRRHLFINLEPEPSRELAYSSRVATDDWDQVNRIAMLFKVFADLGRQAVPLQKRFNMQSKLELSHRHRLRELPPLSPARG